MAKARTPTVYSIPAGTPFVDALAAGLWRISGQDAEAFSRQVVLLPTRRACRAFQDACLRLLGGQAVVLPRLLPLGGLEEEELALAGGQPSNSDADGLGAWLGTGLPSAIAPLHRQLLLTEVILRGKQVFGEEDLSPDQAAALARELGNLLDQVQTEDVSFEDFAGLVPEDFADHWKKTLDFLKIVTEEWPNILDSQDVLDPAERRNRLLDAQADFWRDHPPAFPVIAAGSTGSIPATARLLEVVASLPSGMVVLPGFDETLDKETAALLEPTHPQYGMIRLLSAMKVKPHDVGVWPQENDQAPGARARRRLVNQALLPAERTAAWRGADIDPEALKGLTRIDCTGPEEEARAVALKMRETLETPGRTAALITPDRNLARRVAGELKRWDILVDDSAGTPLSKTPVGTFLSLVAETVLGGFAPVPFLSLAKHPLAAGRLSPSRFRPLTRALELAALRGVRPGPGLKGIRDAARRRMTDALGNFITGLEERTAALAALANKPAPLSDFLRAHMAVAEALAESDESPGAARLWRREDGEAASGFFAEILENADGLSHVDAAHYPALIRELMGGLVVRPRYGLHPRLAIWGLLEARLQHADVTILGGLNEGTWPADVGQDPWLSRPMREQLGLPLPERRTGLSAHDFAQAFCARQVVLTRSERVEGVPTVPSRWLLRLAAVLEGQQLKIENGQDWLGWGLALDRPEKEDLIKPPSPKPPVDARPREISVTEVEQWMRDPYQIYAKRILGLRALDPLDEDPGAAHYGTLFHHILDRFYSTYQGDFPGDALRTLIKTGEDVFKLEADRPAIQTFWWPRFVRAAEWLVERESARFSGVQRTYSEVAGNVTYGAAGGPFVLKAKADRVDELAGGGLEIIDYKTGALPKLLEISKGVAPQLPLEAAMIAQGGVDGVKALPVHRLTYWRLHGGPDGGEEWVIPRDNLQLAEEAWEGFKALVDTFDNPETGYESRPRPNYAPRYSDYEHLARIKEWSAGDWED